MCEHFIAHGLCTDFPDWSIAAAGSEDSIKIGYDYGRFVTGEEQDGDFDLSEEGMKADGSQVVPDPLEEKTMVATSAEVFILMVASSCKTHEMCIVSTHVCTKLILVYT